MTNRPQLIDAVEVTDTGVHLVRLKRTFDATNVNEFEKVLAYLLSRQQYRIVVDLTQVEFVASAGWGAFTAEFRNVRKAGGDIRLAGMNPDVQDVFFLLELDSFINAYETMDEAIASFEGAREPASLPANAESHAAEAAGEYEEEQLEIAAPQTHAPSFAREEEPMAFEVADVYEPEYRAPLALGAGQSKTPEPEYKPLSSPAEDAEGWVIAEEVESESTEITTYSAHENFEAFASEITFDTIDEVVVEESTEDAPDFVDEAQAAPTKALPSSSHFSRTASDEWPETQTEENLAAEDFELQDIHDPWILEEIDTLPEEDELEETNWEDNFEEAPVAAPVKPAPPLRVASPTKLPQTMATPSAKPAALPERHANHEKPKKPEPPIAPRAAIPNTPRTLADKVKAANQVETMPNVVSTARGESESDHIRRVREIVSAHPHYGPAMIQKFFETQFEPPMQISRSTIYRWLRLADLNTREQRLAFADKANAA